MQKKVGKGWLFYGLSNGIGIGIHIDRHSATVNFLCWYIGWEF